MDIPIPKKWIGKVKLNVVERKYSPKRIIQLPVACKLPKGEYFIAISASETMDISIGAAPTGDLKQLYAILAKYAPKFRRELAAEEKDFLKTLEVKFK